MKNHFTTIAVAATLAFAVNPVYADSDTEGAACKSIVLTAPGSLSQQDCYASGVLTALQNSGQYPDVFASVPPKYIFPNLPSFIPNTACFVSHGSLSATIDGKPVSITTLSAWTNDTKPVIFYTPYSTDYTDNIGAVITQISVFDAKGRFKGNIYSRDVVDLSHFSSGTSIEQDTVVGGSKELVGAKGTFRIESTGIPQVPTSVPINVLKGTLCSGDD